MTTQAIIDYDRLMLTVDLLKAIAHPLRIQIIKLLGGGKRLSVTEIQNALNIEQAIASHHLIILKNRDVLRCKRTGKSIAYFLKDEGIGQMIELAMKSIED